MILPKTNIELQLQRLRKKEVTEAQILENVQKLLEERFTQENRIDSELTSSKGASTNDFNFELLEAENIYHLEHIKKICIDYRLRFLDSRYFKGEVPKSGVSKIKKLEAQHNTELKGFKVMAPSKLFKLEDKDDPLLFAPIGNDYYYLVHKWGNDLHPLRKLLVWPFKNMVNLVFFVLLISYWITLLVPDGLFSKNSSTAEFWIVFFFMFKCIASVVIFYGFALGKNFNPAIWNSKYFNA
ncbi:hypothetical protein [Flagellimonas flava]|uniref:Uncharacterized protein n=1 Tax=Flagellimonas flava TaxID=570519 RepID=A0A1M5IBD1_9FLAO|nr:hypothetical protein [Allomuricauda flava]SHG25562.1 hypothetical protein SAMN04488116_0591 [Allomuricauda flava]